MRTISSQAWGIALLSLATFSLGCSSRSSNPYGSNPTAPAPTSGNSSTIAMAGSVFSPVVDTVAVGTTVTWKNNDGYAHTSTSDTGVWDTGNIAGGASATTTFHTAGTYPYHCTYHVSMGMRGILVVK
jgi:plastocyanin